MSPPSTTTATLVLPGYPLGPASKFSPGPGTHIQAAHIHASIVGRLVQTSTNPKDKNATPVLSVVRPQPPNVRSTPLLPAVGTQVYARIERVTRLQALCEIVVLSDGRWTGGVDTDSATAASVHSSPAPQPFRGIIRAQDVRATEKDKVVMSACFRVGDIVRAVVISLGDQGGYFLSTAGNVLGVMMAWGSSGEEGLFGKGNACVPVSWCEVVDVVSGVREERKVAKPI